MGNEQNAASTVIVTGASKGIGRAIAEKFAAEGYTILLCARNEVNLLAAAEDIRKKYNQAIIKTFTADLSDKTQVLAFGDWCLQQGTATVLVNNAGVYLPGNASSEPDGHLETMMNTNLFSAYHLTRKLLPSFIQQGSGHIFNICSIAALHAYEGGGSYSISKFALNGFSQNLRHELKQSGIKVTAVFPGAVMTDSWGDFDNSNKRIMEAEDIASMILAASKLSAQAVVEEIVMRPLLGDL
ncbi:MAG TPA: SDR family oxidoreductase [Ferruginibacter sp.]|nr:SDR family oxidoreductase [Ferruginibacter sp.]